MQAENRAAIVRIVDHLNRSFSLENSEQYIYQVESIVGVIKNTLPVNDANLIEVVRMLLEEEIFLPAEVVDVDSQGIEDEVLYVSRDRSLGELNRLLSGTLIRVAEVDATIDNQRNLRSEIVKIVGVM